MAGRPKQTTRSSPPGFGTAAQRVSSNSSASSPPLLLSMGSKVQSTSRNAMTAEVFVPASSQSQTGLADAFQYSFPPIGSPPSFETKMSSSVHSNGSDKAAQPLGMTGSAAILMRRLPRNTSREALRSMLLFAKDFLDTEFVTNNFEDDSNFLTAIARFLTLKAAEEARAMLDGKPNTAGQANMIVEVVGGPISGTMGRRSTLEHSSSRGAITSVSPPSTNGHLTRQSSRFDGAFQSMENISPPGGEFSTPDGGSQFQTLFSPQSPNGNAMNERPRVTGKSVIDQDAVDEDTGELLKDPLAYAKNGHSSSTSLPRRSTNSQVPLSRFAGLSLTTNMTSPPAQSFASPRSAANVQTPSSAMSPNMGSMGPNAGYQLANQHYHRHNYPPVNPADQNPPCNTLYVGNLPIDTSEDELKAMFSKQRGYKRLCFRTKQNGPMCFVEFEDVSFATKALNELYGVSLHNSVKGGIRLSFSKNPLGVRTGQPGSLNPSTPLSPQGPISAVNGLGSQSNQGFSTANGPPPGLSAPPGLGMPIGISSGGVPNMTNPMNSGMMNGSFGASGLAFGSNGLVQMRNAPLVAGMTGGSGGHAMGGMNSMNGSYPDYMMGR